MKVQKQLEVNEEDDKKQYLDRFQRLMGVLSNFCRNGRKPPPPNTHSLVQMCRLMMPHTHQKGMEIFATDIREIYGAKKADLSSKSYMAQDIL